MVYWPQLLTLLGIWTIAVISPGPDFVVTMHYSVARSRRDGILVAVGIAAGNAVWITVSLVGLGLLLTHVSWLIEIIRTVGALYLAFLGIKTILHAHHPILPEPSETGSSRRAPSWSIGFLNNISNPKAIAFFSSIFAVLLPAHLPIWLEVSVMAVMVIIDGGWFCLIALLFSLGRVTSTYQRMKKWIDYITGGIFVALGVRLAVSK